LSEDEIRDIGFQIFKSSLLRRLSSKHYVVKSQVAEGWHVVEIKQGKWVCDCTSTEDLCPHLYAAQLHRSTAKLQPDLFDETNLKCRYCGSPDVAKCGFRYNSRGISRRYRCSDCLRKFSINFVENSLKKPSEIVWLLNEVGSLTTKLTELLSELNVRLENVEKK
jgi:DNA-directed RNA polymerase subunit RPC12/RpoP